MARKARRYNAENSIDTRTSRSNRVAIYARLSVDREEKQSESIENQIDIIKAYIADHSELANYKQYIDKGYSGTTFHRPAFEEMMADVKAGMINVIIVKDLSRFGRNDLETSNYLETILPFMQVRFISINDNYDSDDKVDSGKALEIALKNLVNDMYAKDISRKVATTRRSDMESGKFLGREAPFGYVINKVDKNKHFIIDEDAAVVVREIYEMALNGCSMRNIATELTEKGYAIPGEYKKTGNIMRSDFTNYMEEVNGNSEDTIDITAGSERIKKKEWNIGMIHTILHNEAYLGVLVQGKRVARLYEGEKRHSTSEDEWVRIPDAHEPIISKEDFDRVREILESKKEGSKFNSDENKNIKTEANKYKGIVYCGVCGRSLQRVSEVRTREGRKYRQYFFRCCKSNKERQTCACKTRITEKTLEEVLYNSLTDIAGAIAGEEDIRKFIAHMDELLAEYDAKYNKKRLFLTQQLEGCKKELFDEYTKYVADREISKEEYLKKQEKAREEIDDYSDQLDRLEKTYLEKQCQMKSVYRWFKAFLEGRKRTRINLTPDLVKLLVTEIRVFPDHVIEIDIPIKKPVAQEGDDSK